MRLVLTARQVKSAGPFALCITQEEGESRDDRSTDYAHRRTQHAIDHHKTLEAVSGGGNSARAAWYWRDHRAADRGSRGDVAAWLAVSGRRHLRTCRHLLCARTAGLLVVAYFGG